MAMNIQDKNVKNLQPMNMGGQGRIAVSGNQAAMRIPPAVLSPTWRFVSPDSRRFGTPIAANRTRHGTYGIGRETGRSVRRELFWISCCHKQDRLQTV